MADVKKEMPYQSLFDGVVERFVVDADGEGRGLCPFHKDTRPSFGANCTSGLWLCRAGCGDGNARQFVERAREAGLHVDESVLDSLPSGRKEVAVYPYTDEGGNLLYEVVRYEPKTFLARQPDGQGGYTWNLKGVERVPYQLPALLKAVKSGRTVFVTEGEKDADNLRALGLDATCNPGGAGKWREEYSGYLTGADVVILPDNDDPGREHAQAVAESLTGKAKSIKVLALPKLPQKGDVSDWLRGIEPKAAKAKLLLMASTTSVWKPLDNADSTTTSKPNGGGASFNPVRMKDLIKSFRNGDGLNPKWKWGDFIPDGGFVMLAGDPKAGKTTLAAHLVAAISKGEQFLGRPTRRGKVLWLGLDERQQDTARRFDELGAWKYIRFQPGPWRSTPQNLARLEGYVLGHDVELIVIDTLAKFWQVVDENSAAQVDRAVDGILNLARKTKTAVLALHHLRKSPAEGGQDIRGSSALFGSLDVAVLMRKGSGNTRSLQCFSRYQETPEKLMIDLRDGKYSSMAPEEAEAKEDGVLLGALGDEPKTAAEIAQAINLPETSVRRKLLELAKKRPDAIEQEGSGKQGSPKKYRLSTTAYKPKGGGAADKPKANRKLKLKKRTK